MLEKFNSTEGAGGAGQKRVLAALSALVLSFTGRPQAGKEKSLPSAALSSPRNLVHERLSMLNGQVHAPFNKGNVLPTMFKLAEQLNSNLAEYNLIIGDDTSGRLPALLYWRLVNARRKELGMEPAALRFVNGKCEYGTMPKGMVPPDTTSYSRALIVTEYIVSGRNVRNIYDTMDALRDRGRIDVATLGLLGGYSLGFPAGSRLYSVDQIGDNRIDNYL